MAAALPTTGTAAQSPLDLQVVDHSTLQQTNHASAEPWQIVLTRVIKAVVSIKVTSLRCFDTDHATSFEGTGFVVDKARGLILSNRHMVTQGPITATATLENYEEIILQAAYFDPVHDFGFFRYDPATVKFAQIEEIELFPQGAKIGLDIKICGNDAGEKLSILGATLARLDRAAPFYGGGYNDFNINYFQAASGTSGGSSGSPVLDIQGRAVALNAGGKTGAASGYFLPLEPIVRALGYVQRGEIVPRGTLQTVFMYTSYDELKRVGFPETVEAECRERNPVGTGLLKVTEILPEGPGDQSGLQSGDVVVECYEKAYGKRFIDGFHTLWEIIDNSVGKDLQLTVCRGEHPRTFIVRVQDLHSITPNQFLEIGNGIFNPLSYHLARVHHMPVRGIYSAESGIFNWASLNGGFLITQLDGKPLSSLADFRDIYLSLPDRKRVQFRFLTLGDRDAKFGMVEIDHHFYVNAEYGRGVDGGWKRTLLELREGVEETGDWRVKRAPTIDSDDRSSVEILRSSLVMVECRLPYSVDGIPAPSMHIGTGVLIATGSLPLIVTSRAVVLTSICDISVIIGKRNFAARILYHGHLVLLTVDPDMLPPTFPVPRISTREAKIGDAVEIYGLNVEQQPVQRRTEVSMISPLVSMPESSSPLWRIRNTEAYNVADTPDTVGGVLVDPEDTSIIALWIEIKHAKGAYYAGLDYNFYVAPIVEAFRQQQDVPSFAPGCTFYHFHLAKAIDLGMPEHYATRIAAIAKQLGTAPQAVYVEEKTRQSTSDLEVGDFILEIGDEPVARMADIRAFFQAEETTALVLRGAKEVPIVVRSERAPYTGFQKIVCWAGRILQQCPPFALEGTTPDFAAAAAKEGVQSLEEMVYISSRFDGSPWDRVSTAIGWILEIDERKVTNLDVLLEIVGSLRGRDEREYIRVKFMGKSGAVSIVGLRLNPRFWPTWVLEWKGGEWVRTELE